MMRGQAKRRPVLFSSYGPQAIRGSGATELTPDTRTRSQRASAVGFEVVSRLPREPLSKPKPRPRRAEPPKAASGPEGRAGAQHGRMPAEEARRADEARSGAKRSGGAPGPRERTAPTAGLPPKGGHRK